MPCVRVCFFSLLMANCDKIRSKAENSPNNLSFVELCELAACYGWEYRRQNGSHQIFENITLLPEDGRFQNFQNVKSKAKPYQVKQLLKAIKLL